MEGQVRGLGRDEAAALPHEIANLHAMAGSLLGAAGSAADRLYELRARLLGRQEIDELRHTLALVNTILSRIETHVTELERL